MAGNSHLHFITLGETALIQKKDRDTESPNRRNIPRTTHDSPKDALPRPPSAAINRYKANAFAREQKEQKHNASSRPQSAKAPSLTIDVTQSIQNNIKTVGMVTASQNSLEYNSSKNIVHTHAGFPVGAHTSGFYTKLRNETTKSPIKSNATISDMLVDMSISKPPKPIKAFQNQKSRLPTYSQQAQIVIQTSDSWSAEPESEMIESLLATLTDPDGPPHKLQETLAELVKFFENDTDSSKIPKVLYEAGVITILLEIMPRVGYSPDILADCCILLNQVTRNYPPAMQSFSELGGLSVLLQSSEVLSTAYSSIGSMPTHARKQSTVSPSRRTSVISPKKIEIPIMEPVLITIDNEQETFRTVSMDQTSLSHGAFGKFYEPSFSDKLDTAPVPVMKGHISKLLTTLQKIDRLLNMNNSFNTGTDILHCLDQFITDSRNLLHVDTLLLYKIDLDTNELFPFTGEYESETIKYPLGHGLAGYCAELGELINVKSPASSPRFSMDIDCPDLSIPAHSLIAVPIFSSKRVVGVLLALNKMGPGPDFQQIHFDEEDEYFVKSLSFIAGIMLGNAKIIDSMKNTQKKVTVLLDTTRSLASILDLDTLIKRIMDSAKELLSSDRCTLFLHDPERKQLRALIQGRDSVQEIRIPSNAGIAGAAFTSGDAINIPNAYKDSRFNPEVDKQTGYVTRTILCMPIKNIHGQCIGVTQMINKRSGIYSLEDEMILSSFSSQAAVAIEKSQLFKKTEDMRIYLQSILSSITSCVITLSESMKVNTVNRMWFFNAIGYDEAFVRENPAEKWLASNTHLLKDIRQVYKDQQTIYVTDFEIKGKGSDAIVNYQIMPLIGGAGVVLVLDDISSEKRAVQTLGRYMSPALAKQVMEEGSGQLGGKRKKVSILFSDIRSFTTLSEHMDPPEVVDLLNHHFTDAVNAITEEQGILDKFIGDAVMAVFGVPFASPEDAIHACNTALKMKDALVVTNKERASQGKKVIKIGIGVNTGMVLSGNIGSVKRMEFSCIGDAVNLASRTEGLTKFYGITILVTEFTLQETNDLFFTREVEPVIVSGKKLSVRMYELLGKKSDYFEEKMIEACKCYQIGFDFYVRRMFPQAIELFENAIEKNDDGPSKVLVSRCKAYMEEPPPDDWNGVYTAEGK